MATIQIKRRTSAGTGPLTGTTGTIKAGEPLVDFNGEHLYIAKADKTASSGTPLVDADYVAFPSVSKVNSQIDGKITSLALGTASKKNTGTSSGQIPVLDAFGKLVDSVIPKIAITNTFVVASQAEMLALSSALEGDVAVRTDIKKSFILKTTGYSTLANWQELLTPTDTVTSVNGSTGAVSISLSGLGGVASSTYETHVASNLHLTEAQRLVLLNSKNMYIANDFGTNYQATKAELNSNAIEDAFIFFAESFDDYNPRGINYYMGIDKSKVLQPSSVIDGGTY